MVSDNINIEKNKTATPNAWLVMLEVTLTDATVFRLVRNNEDITYEGNVFTAFNFQLDPVMTNSKGQISTLNLKISNVTSLLQPQIQALNGGVGSLVRLIVVSSGLLSEDFAEYDTNYEVLDSSSSASWLSFSLGVPSPLRQRFPLERYKAMGCEWRFEAAECAYDRKVVVGVTLSMPTVSFEITAHVFAVDDDITFRTLSGITGGLEGRYLIKTVTDVDNIEIKTIAGADVPGTSYGGSYTGDGQAGYTICNRNLSDCRIRENGPRFGAMSGMRSGGVRIA